MITLGLKASTEAIDTFLISPLLNLNEYGLERPKIVETIDYINKVKGLRMGYRVDVNDLIKDIYRNAR